MQQADLWEQFLFRPSFLNVRVFLRRIEDTFQTTETGIAFQYIAPFLCGTSVRPHEELFECGDIVR